MARIYRITALILITASLTSGCFGKSSDGYERRRAGEIRKICPAYEISAIFDPVGKRISGTQMLSYRNNSREDLTYLYFHLYPNAFKTYDSAPFPRSEMQRAYPDGFAPGCICIERVFNGEGELDYEIEDTLLKVMLHKPLEPKQRIEIGIYFSALLPPSLGRYGYGDHSFNLGNWYPIIAVHNEMGWQRDPYYDIGDPFYSDTALFDVEIVIPKGYTLAAGGTLVKVREEGEDSRWTFKADLVRDFALVISPEFQVSERRVGDTAVKSFYIGEDKAHGERALEYASKAVEFFSGYFGAYPYSDFSVAESDFYIGGMEYPNLVMIGKQFYTEGETLEYVVVHETAHQWWYGLVGNDEVKEPWLDEALTEYSTMLYFRDRYDKAHFDRIYTEYILSPYKLYEMTAAPGPILRPLSKFGGWSEYTALIYSRGAIMLMELEENIGADKMREALRDYFKTNLYKNAATEDFLEAIRKVSGEKWKEHILSELKAPKPLKQAS